MRRWSMRSHGNPRSTSRGIFARSSICPGEPHEKRGSILPCPFGFTTANEPSAGRFPQSRAFVRPLSPRPCGEMISGIGG